MADLLSKAADFRDRVTIQHNTGEQDPTTLEAINDDTVWPTECETWADVQTLSGRDYVTTNQQGYVATHRVFMRFRAGIKPLNTRLIYDGVKLYVVHVNNMLGKNAKLELLCRSDAPPGV